MARLLLLAVPWLLTAAGAHAEVGAARSMLGYLQREAERRRRARRAHRRAFVRSLFPRIDTVGEWGASFERGSDDYGSSSILHLGPFVAVWAER